MANVIGPDISSYQDDPNTVQGVDFVKMRASAGFVIIRAGQNQWPDRDFKTNWRNAKTAGLPRGSYWFYDSRANPKKQAELWASLFNGDFGELPLFADFEETYNGSFAGWQNWKIFLERIKQLAGGKEIFIYTAYYYWRDNAPNATTQAADLEYFHQYPLWIAGYGVSQPAVPKPWGKNEWLFWQYTSNGNGRLYGAEPVAGSPNCFIDLNYFNGDMTAFNKRFSATGTPSPTPTPTPPPPIEEHPVVHNKLKVTASALRIRKGAGTNFEIIGMLYLGNVVEELNATKDRSWIKIKNKNGLIGWCSGAYLINATDPMPAPPPVNPPTPTPGNQVNKWYRTAAWVLNIRERPNISGKVVGYLLKNDTVQTVDDTNPAWAQIKRLDGLTGWCSKSYLVSLGVTRPSSVRQSLFNGITYLRKEIVKPRKNVVHVLAVNLATVGYEFLVTPSTNTEGILCSRTTTQFLDEFKLHVAINGDGFSALDSSFDPAVFCPSGGDLVKPNGFAASRGVIYSQGNAQPTVYIGRRNQIKFGQDGEIFNAISGNHMVVAQGKVAPSLTMDAPNARTAIGLSRDGKWLTFMVVDGRQPEYSEGVTLPELGTLLISHAVYSAISMDGGDSSTMVIKGVDGEPRVLNSPIDQNIPGKERAVANHLGIFIKSG